MYEFMDDDAGFMKWIDANPDGYVLNTTRSPSASYLLVHRAGCGHLRRRDARQVDKTRDYIKICAADLASLQRWADRHFSGHPSFRRCGTCRP